MLANSPPLPLIIDYVKKEHALTAEDEGDIILALQHRDRVRRIRLWMLLPNLQRLLVAMDEEFPMLEYLYVAPLAKHDVGLALQAVTHEIRTSNNDGAVDRKVWAEEPALVAA